MSSTNERLKLLHEAEEKLKGKLPGGRQSKFSTGEERKIEKVDSSSYETEVELDRSVARRMRSNLAN